MAEIDLETLRHLTKLAKLSLDESEEVQFLRELEQIVRYFDQLNEVDTERVEPLFYVIEGALATPLRDDVVEPTITTGEFLSGVPNGNVVAQMVKVPKIQQ